MAGVVPPTYRNITVILLEAGVVTAAQIEAGLARQCMTGTRIGEALVELGAASESDIGWALARQLGLPFVDLQPEALDAELIRGFPDALLRRLLALPLVREDGSLSAAFGDPTDREALAELERAAGVPVSPSVANPSAIHAALDRLMGGRPEANVRHPATGQPAHRQMDRDRSGARLLQGHLARALVAGAAEIHFLPAGETVHVHHRVGERLIAAGTEPATALYYLLARLEALGGPAFDGDQVHASGRVLCPAGGEEIPLEVSLLGCDQGLAIVLGLRGRPSAPPALEALGLDPVDLARLRTVLALPAGLVLISGPARAGRSTTLASLLAAARAEGVRTLAFAPPRGAPLSTETCVSIEAAHARERWAEIVVAQDPDVVALDHVLTGEAVAGAVASAACGRLVLATTDWSDTFALLEFLSRRPGGAGPLAARLRVVIQQRMAHVRCAPGDRVEGPAGPARPIFETLFVSDALRDALRAGASAAELRACARAEGQRDLADQVRTLASAGRLSASEATRVLS